MTFIAALRHDRISAPWVIDSPINDELFTLYVEKVLTPTLTRGEVVILEVRARPAGAMGRASFDLNKKQGEMIRRHAGLAPMPSSHRSCDAGPLHSF